MKELASLRQRLAELEAIVQPDGLAIEPSEAHDISLKTVEISGSIEQTVESVAEGVVVADDRGRIVHVNKRAESCFGYRDL